MALEKDFELLDDYLANRLGVEEKASFEKQIEADPELKREFVTQQKLVEGIKQARLTELKGMLNNVPISPAPATQALFTKLGIVAVVAGLIGTGVYFFFLKNAPEEVKTQSEIAKQEVPPVEKEVAPSEEPKDEIASKETVAPEVKEKASSKDKEKSSAKSQEKSEQNDEESTMPAKPEAFDPSDEEISDSSTSLQEALRQPAIRSMNSSGLVVDNIPNNKKYDFHYQFSEGKLTLYGQKFRDSSMYEILEFFGNNTIPTTVILYQSKKYYRLKEGNKEITRLTPITDKAVLSRLEEYKRK